MCILEQKVANNTRFHNNVAEERRQRRRRTASCSNEVPYTLRLLALAFPSDSSNSSDGSQRTFGVHGDKGNRYSRVDRGGGSEASSVIGAAMGRSPAKAFSRSRDRVPVRGGRCPVEWFKRDGTRRRRESRSKGGFEARLNQGRHSTSGSEQESSIIQADFGGGGFESDDQDTCVRSDAMLSSLSVRKAERSCDACRCKQKAISPRRDEVVSNGGDDHDAEGEISRHLLSAVQTAICLGAAPTDLFTDDGIISSELPNPQTVYRGAPVCKGPPERIPEGTGHVSAHSQGRNGAKNQLPAAVKPTQHEDLGILTEFVSRLADAYVEQGESAGGRSLRGASSERGGREVARSTMTATSATLSRVSTAQRDRTPVSPFTVGVTDGGSSTVGDLHREEEASLHDDSVSCRRYRCRPASLLQESPKAVGQHASDTQTHERPTTIAMSYANDDKKCNNTTTRYHQSPFPTEQTTPTAQVGAPAPALIDTECLETASDEDLWQHADSRIGEALHEGQAVCAPATEVAETSSAKRGIWEGGLRTETNPSSFPTAVAHSLSNWSRPWEYHRFDGTDAGATNTNEEDREASETVSRQNLGCIFYRRFSPPRYKSQQIKCLDELVKRDESAHGESFLLGVQDIERSSVGDVFAW